MINPLKFLVPGTTYQMKNGIDGILDIFGGSEQHGIIHSKKTNSVIIIINEKNEEHKDLWVDDVLYYYGAGRKGDQQINKISGNWYLSETIYNCESIYLFNLVKNGTVEYQCEVVLLMEPFSEYIPSEKRSKLVFPLVKKDKYFVLSQNYGESISFIDKIISKMPLEEKKRRVYNSNPVRLINYKIGGIYRNPYVRRLALDSANGICELCGEPGPFDRGDETMFLESHHIVPLSEGGKDTVNNIAGLCPNCHRKMHHIKSADDRNTLLLKKQ